MKRILALLTAMVMLLCIAAVGEEYPHTYEYPAPITEEARTLKVMWYIQDNQNIDVDGLWYNEHLEKLTGVHVDIQAVSESDFKNQLNYMYASGDYPDIVIDSGNCIDAEMYGVDQKVFLPLDDIIEEYMPNYKMILGTNDTAYLGMIASDGHLYSVGKIADANAPSGTNFMFLNQNWLDELDLELPQTQEELYDILVAFKAAHPDNNIFESRFTEMIYTIPQMWGIVENSLWFSITDEGEVVFNATRDGYREAIDFLAQLYADGIMDPASLTQDHSARLVKLNDADVGFATLWRLRSYGCDPLIGKMTFVAPIPADGFEPRVDFQMPLATNCVWITTACEDVELAAKWIDYQLTPQLTFESFYGPEGILWTWNENGQCVLGENGDRGSTDYAYNVAGIYYLPGEYYATIFLQPEFRLERSGYCQEIAGMRQKYPTAYVTQLAKPTTEEAAEIAKLKANIDTLMQEQLAAFIMNGITDEGWEEFMAKLNNAGIERYIEIYQGVFDKYMGN